MNLSRVPNYLLRMANPAMPDSLCQASVKCACKKQDLGSSSVSFWDPPTSRLDCSRMSWVPGRFGGEWVKPGDRHKMCVRICAHRATAGPPERWEEDCWGETNRKALHHFYYDKLWFCNKMDKEHIPPCSRVVVLSYPLRKGKTKGRRKSVWDWEWEQRCLPFPCFYPGADREMILLVTSQLLFPVSAIKQDSDSCILHAFCSFLSQCQEAASVPPRRSSWKQWDFQCAPSPGKG